MDRQMLTAAEVCKRLGLAPETLRQWRKENRGPPFVQFGPRSPRYPSDLLEQWLRSQVRGDAVDDEPGEAV